jgi:hypothetical protein
LARWAASGATLSDRATADKAPLLPTCTARRGLGTALTALHVHDALARGCQTASLQSTEMAEGVHAAVGFRDLGRILEYVP